MGVSNPNQIQDTSFLLHLIVLQFGSVTPSCLNWIGNTHINIFVYLKKCILTLSNEKAKKNNQEQ